MKTQKKKVKATEKAKKEVQTEEEAKKEVQPEEKGKPRTDEELSSVAAGIAGIEPPVFDL